MNPYISSLKIKGKQGKIVNVFYTADGLEAHPTLIFAHGFPGHEKNFDLAQDLRKRGFHVLIFFYSGCWGSDGVFSFKNSIDDVNAVLDFMINSGSDVIDKGNLFFLGHSLGCFAAAVATVRSPDVKGCIFLMPCDLGRFYFLSRSDAAMRQSLEAILSEGAQWLSGVTKEDLWSEIAATPFVFSYDSMLEALLKKPVLWISGKNDEIAQERVHTAPHRIKLENRTDSKIEFRSIKTDHYFSNSRAQITYEIVSFLKRNVIKREKSFCSETFAEDFSEFIATQYRTTSLQDAANYFEVSVPYLSCLIKKRLGKSFTSLLTEFKMNNAGELLVKADLSLNEISEFLGYTDPAYFMKVFKKFYQLTPTEYRNLHA